MASQTKKISKKDRAAIVENCRALEGFPRSLTLFAFDVVAGEDELRVSAKVAAPDHAEAEYLVRRMYDVLRVLKVESLGRILSPA
jgi:hypothetical protein